MAGPLNGLRVLDLGTRIAAPFCAGLLGEQGAEVIKIEQPGTGDFMREIGPFLPDDEDGSPGYSLFWAVEGRGRKSVTLNLRTPEGQDLFRRLAATADVVVENFRPGTLERWHIAPTDLDDSLVTVRISTFGQDGPYSERPGLDRVGIGYGGLLHLTGYPDRPPVRVGVTISDYMTGIFAAQAATAALYSRDVHRSGKGAVVDAALYGVASASSNGRSPRTTSSGWCAAGRATGSRTALHSTTTPPPTASTSASSRAPTPTSPGCAARWSSRSSSTTRASPVWPIAPHAVTRSTGSSRTGPGRATPQSSRPPASPTTFRSRTAYTAADMFLDPHFAARGDLMTIADPVAGPMRQQAPYPRFVDAPQEAPAGAPRLGEHTDEVLETLIGLDPSEVAALREQGIV